MTAFEYFLCRKRGHPRDLLFALAQDMFALGICAFLGFGKHRDASLLCMTNDFFLLCDRLLTQLINDLSPFFARHCDELALLGFDRLLALCGEIGVPKSALDLSLSSFKHCKQRLVEEAVEYEEKKPEVHPLDDEQFPIYSECG